MFKYWQFVNSQKVQKPASLSNVEKFCQFVSTAVKNFAGLPIVENSSSLSIVENVCQCSNTQSVNSREFCQFVSSQKVC